MSRAVLLLCALLACRPAAAIMRGSAPSETPRYPDWATVAGSWPCELIKRDGRDYRIIGPVIVAGELHRQYLIKDDGLIRLIVERCHFRLE
jgi:hypothetical protein